MIRHLLFGALLPITIILGLASCKGASTVEENKKENLDSTTEVVQVQPDSLMEEAFRQAAHDGDMGRVKALLKQGIECNVADQDGHTALMFAAMNGHLPACELLVANGADANAANDAVAAVYVSIYIFIVTYLFFLFSIFFLR